ncbi:MAG: hypothetical protein J5885_04180 [Clostridia bacterium]|nr:hypothetical protein [Clostridia bacterium]
MKTISLTVIADAIEETMDGWKQYYNTTTGEIKSIPDIDNPYISMDGFLDTADEIDSSDEWRLLPTQWELHEYDIMERFAEEQDSEQLFHALRGRKPFRTFKDNLAQLNLSEYY